MKLQNYLPLFVLFCLPLAAQVRELPSPASNASGQPNLTVAANGRVYLSWIDRLEGGRVALRFATKEANGWSSPRTIAEGINWFVNWADFPSMLALPDGSLAAHWLAKSGAGTYAYDVNLARSLDGGKTWRNPFLPHRDGTQTEHGFVSLLPASNGAFTAIWLDGREMASQSSDHNADNSKDHGHGTMTLRAATIRRNNAIEQEALLDAKVCECCQTSAAMTALGPVVVYRDRSDQEIRDISIVRLRNGRWSAPKTVFQDGWQINGCPVNGPAVAAFGKRVAVAWFTGANNQSQVKIAFSNDAGETFGTPVIIDDGNPAGRVEVLMMPEGTAIVSWLEKLASGGEVRIRKVKADGTRAASITIATSGTARSSGFPQMVRSGDSLIFAWMSNRVLTAELSLK
ncbi:MAG: exo-alpha-sialidase [Blastocatellia bacterium]|nr:exo-alpha-sialidase [Blastocatellia bacterium]